MRGSLGRVVGRGEGRLSRLQHPLPRRLVKFQGVNWLTIFVESNQEDEETTVIEKIVVQGIAGDSFDVGSIKDVSKE